MLLVIAVANHHKLNGLKPEKLIYNSGGQKSNIDHWAKIEVLVGLHCFWRLV
jgi:hypothetical protein